LSYIVSKIQRIQWWAKQFPITCALLSINVIVWILERIIGDNIILGGAFHPILAVEHYQIWRFITSTFMHSGIIHLVCNMWGLVICGPIFEQFFKWRKFLVIYLASGVIGNVFFASWFFLSLGTEGGWALGASGSIFGLFSGMIILYRRLGIDPTQILLVVIINLVISFSVSGIAWEAHVGGVVAGIILTKAFLKKRQ
jgi:membrane associated rhomboid family serine protease